MDGFSAPPTVLAIDPVQSLVALGAPGGRIRVYPRTLSFWVVWDGAAGRQRRPVARCSLRGPHSMGAVCLDAMPSALLLCGRGVRTYGQEGAERMLQLPGRRDVKFLQFDVNDVRLLAPPSTHARTSDPLTVRSHRCALCPALRPALRACLGQSAVHRLQGQADAVEPGRRPPRRICAAVDSPDQRPDDVRRAGHAKRSRIGWASSHPVLLPARCFLLPVSHLRPAGVGIIRPQHHLLQHAGGHAVAALRCGRRIRAPV